MKGSRRWLTFIGAMGVGLAAAVLTVGVARAAQRARRRTPARSPGKDPGAGRAPVLYPVPTESELDEELAQTFPASDPLPYSHRVD